MFPSLLPTGPQSHSRFHWQESQVWSWFCTQDPSLISASAFTLSHSSEFHVMTIPHPQAPWLVGIPLSNVVWQLAPRAWCPLGCLQARGVSLQSPVVGRSIECAQKFAV